MSVSAIAPAPYPLGALAFGTVATGAVVRFQWDGALWNPLGRLSALPGAFQGLARAITDAELRASVTPDLRTLVDLGGRWADAAPAIPED